jgi:lipoyl(octanoyl) transferase
LTAALGSLVTRWLGRVGFDETAALQERLRADVLAGRSPETLLLLEHDPVITLGRSADGAHVLCPEDELRRRGIAVARASRGGDVTYHGPGQLVGYPIVRLRRGVLHHVQAMASAVAGVLATLGIDARFRREAPGLWVASPFEGSPNRDGGLSNRDGGLSKICAIGVHVHRRVAIHGFALNLDPDLSAFDLIVPCGLAGATVTSVRALAGHSPTPAALATKLSTALAAALAFDALAFEEIDQEIAPTRA